MALCLVRLGCRVYKYQTQAYASADFYLLTKIIDIHMK